LKEINDFASVLDTAITARDAAIVSLAVTTVGAELRELTEQFPDRKDTSVVGGQAERAAARMALKQLVLNLRRIDMAAAAGEFDEAAAEYRNYINLTFAAVPMVLRTAEPWSLFNPKIHDAHYGALWQMRQAADRPSH
jgi:hypothetical protein